MPTPTEHAPATFVQQVEQQGDLALKFEDLRKQLKASVQGKALTAEDARQELNKLTASGRERVRLNSEIMLRQLAQETAPDAAALANVRTSLEALKNHIESNQNWLERNAGGVLVNTQNGAKIAGSYVKNLSPLNKGIAVVLGGLGVIAVSRWILKAPTGSGVFWRTMKAILGGLGILAVAGYVNREWGQQLANEPNAQRALYAKLRQQMGTKAMAELDDIPDGLDLSENPENGGASPVLRIGSGIRFSRDASRLRLTTKNHAYKVLLKTGGQPLDAKEQTFTLNGPVERNLTAIVIHNRAGGKDASFRIDSAALSNALADGTKGNREIPVIKTPDPKPGDTAERRPATILFEWIEPSSATPSR